MCLLCRILNSSFSVLLPETHDRQQILRAPGALQTGQYSTQIFSLAVLLSSLFIYNQMGGIDEAALDRLSLVTEMTKHIRVRSEGAAGVCIHCLTLTAVNPCSGSVCMPVRRMACPRSSRQPKPTACAHEALEGNGQEAAFLGIASSVEIPDGYTMTSRT